MPRIKIITTPVKNNLRSFWPGGPTDDECPEGQKKDQFGNCVPDFNYQPAQQKMGTRSSSVAAADNSPKIKFKITGIADEAPPEDVVAEQKKDAEEMQNKQNFMNNPKNEMTTASWAQDFNNKFNINTPGYNPDTKYDKKGNVVKPKTPGNFWKGTGNFWEGALKVSRAKENFDNAIAPIAAGLNLWDNYQTDREQKRRMQDARAVENSHAYDNSFAKRGHYDVNEGMLDQSNMGAKSIVGQLANPIYTQNFYSSKFGGLIKAAQGMEAPSLIPVKDSFIPLSSTYVPLLSEMAMPTYSAAPVPASASASSTYSPKSTVSLKGADIATKTNNPGNLLYKPIFGQLFGAVDSGIKQKDGTGTFAAFPNVELGLKARETQMFGEVDGTFKSRYYKPNTTVDEALRKWSNDGYNGSLYPKIANKTLAEVTPEERRELMKRQIKMESNSMYKQLKQAGIFATGGQNYNNMKIRITGGPDEMAYGGQSTGGGLDVGTRKVYGDQPKNPFDSLGKTLHPVPRHKANIEAEKGETIFGDMDGDGQMEHMVVGGKRHSEGGTPLNVPKGSFVFSDTRKMRIKDENILKYFGVKPVKGGVTPADIAKKFDVNKYKAVLQDPNADKLQKDTAKKMIDSYEDKLGYLALIQESMKGFPNGLPAVAQKVMGAVEGTSEMAYGGNVPLHLYQGDEGSSTVSNTGGFDPNDPIGIKSRFDALTYGPKITINGNTGTTTVGSATGPTVNPASTIPKWYTPWLKSNTKAGSISPTGLPTVFDPKDPNKFYNDYNYWKKTIGRDFTGPEDFQSSIYDYVGKQDPKALEKMWTTWGSTAAGLKNPKDAKRGFVDKYFGARTADVMGWRPEEKPTPTTPPDETQRYICQNGQVSSLAPNATVPPGATVFNSLDEANKACAGKPAESTTTLKPGEVPIPGTFKETKGSGPGKGVNRIDARNLGAAYADLGLLQQFHSDRPSIQAELQKAIPVDWRGAAAALQSGAQAQAEMQGIFQGGQGQAANNSYAALQQFNQLQNIIRSVDDKNADIYNKTLADRAGTMNLVNQYNNENRIKRMQDENEMKSAYLAAVSDKMKNVVAAKNKLEENATMRYNQNITEPYFQIDPQNRVVFNSDKAREEYIAAMKNPGSMTAGTDSDVLKKYYDLAISHGFTPAEARVKSWELATGKKAPAEPKTQQPT